MQYCHIILFSFISGGLDISLLARWLTLMYQFCALNWPVDLEIFVSEIQTLV